MPLQYPIGGSLSYGSIGPLDRFDPLRQAEEDLVHARERVGNSDEPGRSTAKLPYPTIERGHLVVVW
jgi:hypothetical protein